MGIGIEKNWHSSEVSLLPSVTPMKIPAGSVTKHACEKWTLLVFWNSCHRKQVPSYRTYCGWLSSSTDFRLVIHAARILVCQVQTNLSALHDLSLLLSVLLLTSLFLARPSNGWFCLFYYQPEATCSSAQNQRGITEDGTRRLVHGINTWHCEWIKCESALPQDSCQRLRTGWLAHF